MTAKEKAIELVELYDNTLTYLESKSNSKKCALIAVNMLIECTPSVNIYPPNFQKIHQRVREYWQEVKKEIELL